MRVARGSSGVSVGGASPSRETIYQVAQQISPWPVASPQDSEDVYHVKGKVCLTGMEQVGPGCWWFLIDTGATTPLTEIKAGIFEDSWDGDRPKIDYEVALETIDSATARGAYVR